jgi:hypothetical protein
VIFNKILLFVKYMYINTNEVYEVTGAPASAIGWGTVLQCGILDLSQPHRPSRFVTRIALLYLFLWDRLVICVSRLICFIFSMIHTESEEIRRSVLLRMSCINGDASSTSPSLLWYGLVNSAQQKTPLSAARCLLSRYLHCDIQGNVSVTSGSPM